MRPVHIGDKTIDADKVHRLIDEMLDMRVRGLSQQEVAEHFRIDRTFISRLENLGEIKKGGSLALIGFPVKNKEELESIAKENGVEFIFLLSEKERWDFVTSMDGVQLFNRVLDIIAQLRNFDKVIFLGSDKRTKLVEAILGNEVITIDIGESPITHDVYVDSGMFTSVIKTLKG
ncbi:MAG: transcriptional regulator [Thermoanaerobacteraceae bacterium]|nr:transcriptional regulator [Thermoanaerobacteraceae bacterium]